MVFQKEALAAAHDQIGHPGRDRMLEILKERFYWPDMSKDVAEYIAPCDRYLDLRFKSPTNQRAPLVSIQTTYPLDLICLVFFQLEESKGGVSNILVLTHHYTRYAQAFPTTNQTALITAKVLYNNFIVHYRLSSTPTL